MVDLRDAATREALGLGDLGSLTGAWDAPQSLANRLTAMGAQGAIVPSAARPDAWNLVVFPAGFDRVSVRRGRTMHPAPPA